MDERDFSKLKNIRLTPSDTRIMSYGNNNLHVRGYFHAKAESNTASTYAKFYVIAGSGGSLLGLTTSIELKLVNIVQNISPVMTSQTSLEVARVGLDPHTKRLVEEYSDLFKDLGKLKDFSVKLHIDETIKPVAQPHRRVPFHVRSQLENQLKADEALGVIERVDGATPWVSPLVVVPKPKCPDQVRVGVDMRRANTAVLR